MPTPFLSYIYMVILTLIIVAGGVLLVWVIWRVLHVRRDRQHSLCLDNLGNCRQVYHLTVHSPEPALKFSFSFNRLPLAQVFAEPEPEEEEILEEPQITQAAQAQPQAAQNSSVVAKTGKAVGGSAGKLASLLNEVGGFLPGSLGQKLEDASNKTRAVQMKSLRVARKEQRLRNTVSRVTGKKPSGRAASAQKQPARGQARLIPLYFVTPELESGQSLTLVVQIQSRLRRFQHGSYPYFVQVQPIAVDFPNLQVEPVTRGSTVHIAPVSGWRYALPVLFSLVVVLLTVILLVRAYQWIW